MSKEETLKDALNHISLLLESKGQNLNDDEQESLESYLDDIREAFTPESRPNVLIVDLSETTLSTKMCQQWDYYVSKLDFSQYSHILIISHGLPYNCPMETVEGAEVTYCHLSIHSPRKACAENMENTIHALLQSTEREQGIHVVGGTFPLFLFKNWGAATRKVTYCGERSPQYGLFVGKDKFFLPTVTSREELGLYMGQDTRLANFQFLD